MNPSQPGVRSAGGGADAGSRLVLGDLQLDLARRKASRAGQAIALTSQEFQLLGLLMRRAGEVLSRTVLAEQVWDMNFDSETNVVEVAVRSLSLLAMRRGLSPVRALSDEAARIRPGAYLERLTLPVDSAELLPLAERFNEVLERVESAWRQLEGFNADVAHELRMPLAILINGAELALERDQPPAEMRDVIESHLEELRALASMVSDMLFLARADRGEVPDNLESISVRADATSVGDFVEALLAERQQRLVVTGDARLLANRTLVRRALVNLLINGSRHAPEGSELAVLIAADRGFVNVVVRNPGPPIPEDVRQRMFDRFWRGEHSRVKSGERFGLGLAIVRAIARMHGGDTSVHCADGHNDIGFTLST